MRFAAGWVMAALTTGCGAPGLDEASVRARAAARNEQGFVQINRDPTVSAHMGMPVNVWVTAPEADDYRAITRVPDAGALPPGTIVVKEQLDPMGRVAVLTVMAKGPPGYAPDAGDWYWAQTSPAGRVNGGFSGQVDFCIQCHAARVATDWVWGVAPPNQR